MKVHQILQKKDIPHKWMPKENWDSITYIKHIYSKTKTVIRNKEAHYDKEVNPTRGYNIYKYLGNQYKST